ncbi:MAG: hypothetical protein EOP72_04255, partial [Variovorax sp.]
MSSYLTHLEELGRVKEIAKLINTHAKDLLAIEPPVQFLMAGYPSTKYFYELTSSSERLSEDPNLNGLNWSEIHTQSQLIANAVKNISSILQNRPDLPDAIASNLNKLNIDSQDLDNLCREKAIKEQDSFKSSLSVAFDENKDLRQKIKELNDYLNISSQEVDSLKSKVDLAIKEKTADLENTAATVTNKYIDFDDQMKSKEEQINNMLGRVSGATISKEFSISGIKELNLYYNFRKWVIGLLAMIPGVIVFLIFFAGQVTILSTEFFLRLSLIVSLVALTTYLARESSKHRTLGNKYTQTGLYLNTLDPYLESLEILERNKIKSELALKLFFSLDDKDNSDSMPINPQEVINK